MAWVIRQQEFERAVNAIASAIVGYVQKVVSGGSLQAGGKASSVAAAAMQEATETTATARKEAALGDRMAMQKLARLQRQQQIQDAAPANEPGKGELVNRRA